MLENLDLEHHFLPGMSSSRITITYLDENNVTRVLTHEKILGARIDYVDGAQQEAHFWLATPGAISSHIILGVRQT